MAYLDIVPVGAVLAMCAASFGLGAVYGNLPYDYYTLWLPNREAIAISVAHYALWANAPRRVHHILHVVMALGLCGCFIKLFKPHPEAKYFEWGTLAAIMVAIMIYFTNLRIGVNSCVTGQWGDVDEITGVNVMAASQFMIAVALFGVLVLQGGLYYAQWYENKMRKEFLKNEAAQEAAEIEQISQTEMEKEKKQAASTATTTGAKKSKAKQR